MKRVYHEFAHDTSIMTKTKFPTTFYFNNQKSGFSKVPVGEGDSYKSIILCTYWDTKKLLILPLLVTTCNINIGNFDLNNGNEDRCNGTGTRIEKRISRALDLVCKNFGLKYTPGKATYGEDE